MEAAVDEAIRLIDGDGGTVYMLSTRGASLRLAIDSGEGDRRTAVWSRGISMPAGTGLLGRALEGATVASTPDYASDASFVHTPSADRAVAARGIRSMIVAPLVADGIALGALGVFARRPSAFSARDEALVRALASHAAVTLANARLIDDLARSEAALAARVRTERSLRDRLERRAERERALRDLVAGLAAIHDPELLLERVVAEAAAISGSKGAFLDTVTPSGSIRSGYARGVPGDVRELLRRTELPRGEGLMGRAIEERRTLVTDDYLADATFGHVAESDELATGVGIRSLIAAPLVAGDATVGVLAAYSDQVAAYDQDDVALISAFADHAAIAISNVRLYEQLQASETRYRELLEASPDIVFQVDAEGTFTFVSETIERLIGWTPAEIVGRHFSAVIDVDSMGDALERWQELRDSPDRVVSARFRLVHRDGRRIPFEVRSSGRFMDGSFVGVHGSARDVSDRDRLERELRESEERYREIVAASPDLIWETDAEGVFTFVSATVRSLIGYEPEEVVGRHFQSVLHPDTTADAFAAWTRLAADPLRVQPARFSLAARDGTAVPVENFAIARVEDGRFVGAHGAARDVRERERLERELSTSEAQYRYLVENSPDIVWSANAQGILTYMSDTSERVLGWRPDELIGKQFAVVIHSDSLAHVQAQYAASLAGAPARELRYRFLGRHRNGTAVPLEMHARTIVEDGRYLGTHGAVRDLRERDRLERDLRRQAAELAANEERGRLARELHDSVTQALFSMTLIARSIEVLMDRDPAEARRRISTLHGLQRDALAEMRALIFELRPGSLETEGLARALQTHATAVEGRTGLPIVIEADEGERLPPELEAAVFRIAQEALHNVVKHARAHKVRIGLHRDADRVRLVVEDDGAGFDLDRAAGDGHLGLAGMRTRAENLGGSLWVESSPGRGTTVRAELPVSTAAANVAS